MSVRMALAKLTVAVAGCALVGGGAVHTAEPSDKNQGFVKHVKQAKAKPIKQVKRRAAKRVVRHRSPKKGLRPRPR